MDSLVNQQFAILMDICDTDLPIKVIKDGDLNHSDVSLPEGNKDWNRFSSQRNLLTFSSPARNDSLLIDDGQHMWGFEPDMGVTNVTRCAMALDIRYSRCEHLQMTYIHIYIYIS